MAVKEVNNVESLFSVAVFEKFHQCVMQSGSCTGPGLDRLMSSLGLGLDLVSMPQSLVLVFIHSGLGHDQTSS